MTAQGIEPQFFLLFFWGVGAERGGEPKFLSHPAPSLNPCTLLSRQVYALQYRLKNGDPV
jgi:hypothetical protein